MPPELREAMRDLARSDKITQTDLVNSAIYQYLISPKTLQKKSHNNLTAWIEAVSANGVTNHANRKREKFASFN